jgi:hypothetical protein
LPIHWPGRPAGWHVAGRRGVHQDRALSRKSQRRSIEALGGVQAIIEMDTCHDLMVSEPKRLAEILVERCRQYE